jgi:hypothetical protein
MAGMSLKSRRTTVIVWEEREMGVTSEIFALGISLAVVLPLLYAAWVVR